MGKKWKQWQILFSWAPKSLQTLTAASKLKDACFLEGSYDKSRQHIKNQSKDIILPIKVYTIKAMVFPVVMYGYDSWTIRKAECWRIDAFELWCWRRLLRTPWTSRRSSQAILKEISSEFVGLLLKLQYVGHLMWRAKSLEKTLMLGKTEGNRREQQRMRWLGSITNSMDINLNKF